MYYDYNSFLRDCKILLKMIEDSNFKPDGFLYIARGGLTLAHFISLAMDMRNMYSINAIGYTPSKTQHDLILSHLPKIEQSARKILILDEIVDTGTSLSTILMRMREEYPLIEFKSACLFQKEDASIKADFYVNIAKEWIDFFWEADLK